MQITSEQATLFVALATLFGAFIGSVVQVALSYLETKRQRNTLRRSFLAELNSMPTIDEKMLAIIKVEGSHELLPTMIYHSNNEEIGQLEPKEAEAVVRFYSYLIWYQSHASKVVDLGENDSLRETYIGVLDELEKSKNGAIEALEENLESNALPLFASL